MVEVRNLLHAVPNATGVHASGDDAVVHILEPAGVVRHDPRRPVFPAGQPLEGDFKSGPVFAFRIKNAVADMHTGVIYDAKGAVIREAFGTNGVMERFIQRTAPPAPGEIVDAAGPVLPIATTRINNYCRWWLDSMAKMFVVDRSIFGDLRALPTIAFDRGGFQRAALDLLDDVRLIGERGPRYQRGDIVSSAGVTYNGGQRIGHLVNDLGRYFFERSGQEVPSARRRLFISRQSARIRRIVNEGEFRARLEAEGFETIELEHMTIGEQMAAIASAAVIVAPHGAGLTNLLWVQPGTTLVEIFPEGGVHGSAFMRMATQMAVRYLAVVGAARDNRDKSGNANNADIELDVPAVMDFLAENALTRVAA